MKIRRKDRRIFYLTLRFFFIPIKLILNSLLNYSKTFILWRSGKAIGDQILMAGLAKVLNTKFNSKIVVISNYSNVLSLSPWIYKSISYNEIKYWRLIYYFLKLIEGKRIIEYNFPYRSYGYESHLEAYRDGFYKLIKEPPIWHAHVADRFESFLFENFTGGLKCTKSKSAAKKIIKFIRKNYSQFKIGIINPTGKITYTEAKSYGFRNYQQIINLTQKKIKWIQVGREDEPLLENIHLDTRGKSLNFLVDLISLSDLVLSDEGLLNHIAGSFQKVNSYIVFSEFSPKHYYSYENTITIGELKETENINYWSKKYNNNINIATPSELAKIILKREFSSKD